MHFLSLGKGNGVIKVWFFKSHFSFKVKALLFLHGEVLTVLMFLPVGLCNSLVT